MPPTLVETVVVPMPFEIVSPALAACLGGSEQLIESFVGGVRAPTLVPAAVAWD